MLGPNLGINGCSGLILKKYNIHVLVQIREATSYVSAYIQETGCLPCQQAISFSSFFSY